MDSNRKVESYLPLDKDIDDIGWKAAQEMKKEYEWVDVKSLYVGYKMGGGMIKDYIREQMNKGE